MLKEIFCMVLEIDVVISREWLNQPPALEWSVRELPAHFRSRLCFREPSPLQRPLLLAAP